MKKLLLMAAFAGSLFNAGAQTLVNDSAMIGSTNEVWYQLSSGTKVTQPRTNWDLGFTTEGFDATILFNHSIGNFLYIAQGATIATFTNVVAADTSAAPIFNTDSTWVGLGALNQQPVGSYNYGWGSYNTTTHNITGNRVFIVKYPGGVFKKFYIEKLDNGSVPYTYTLVYADINNANQQTTTIQKQTYSTKNFVYYSLTNNALVDREPASSTWDLLFTKYCSSTELYMGVPNQVVAGTLQNIDVLAAQANSITSPTTYTNYGAHQFSTNINILGWDWKGLNASFQYTVEPNRAYFVQDANSDIYRIVYISYTGGSTGKFKFSKQLITSTTTSINEAKANNLTLGLYPNPSTGDNVTLVFSAKEITATPVVTVMDLNGRVVKHELIENTVSQTLNQYTLPTAGLSQGVYILNLQVGGASLNQKLVINN